MQNERVSLNEAAQILGMSPQAVREKMKRGLFNPPIGRVLMPVKGRKKQYLIYQDMLNNYTSVKEEFSETKNKSKEELAGEVILNAVKQIMSIAYDERSSKT